MLQSDVKGYNVLYTYEWAGEVFLASHIWYLQTIGGIHGGIGEKTCESSD